MVSDTARRMQEAYSFNDAAIDHDTTLCEPDYQELCELRQECLKAALTVAEHGVKRIFVEVIATSLPGGNDVVRLDRMTRKRIVRSVPGTPYFIDSDGLLYINNSNVMAYNTDCGRYTHVHNTLLMVSYKTIRELPCNGHAALRRGLKQIQ